MFTSTRFERGGRNVAENYQGSAEVKAELIAESQGSTFSYRANMVEMSPLGTGVVLHFGRKWDDIAYGGKGKKYIDTFFDGPHLWPLNLDYKQNKPLKISVSETHSGWAFAQDGREMFISQNNRTDKLDAVYLAGDDAGYDNRVEIGAHDDFGWTTGFHYGKMPQNKKGWAFVNTYANVSKENHGKDWSVDQLLMVQIKPMTNFIDYDDANNPTIWRIAPNYNLFDGNYRDEAPAAINLFGNRIYLTTNWGDRSNPREVYMITLPDNWDDNLLD